MDIQAERKRVKRQVNLIWHYFKEFKSRMAQNSLQISFQLYMDIVNQSATHEKKDYMFIWYMN